MSDKQPQYIEGIGWRYDTVHSMHRRMTEHDYHTRSIYMITMSVEDRLPLLGELKWKAADGSDAHIETTRLGAEVERCWMAISDYYPDAKPLKVQIMPDHIHGLLFVKRDMAAHLGQIINGFKVGCNRAYRRLVEGNEAVGCHEAMPQETEPAPTAKPELAPWPYHMEKRKISRWQCLELNEMARSISTEPWTQELEARLSLHQHEEDVDVGW